MADLLPNSIPDIDEVRARWGSFAWTAENADKPYRVKLRPTGFSRLQAMDFMTKGHMLADVTAILGSLDIVFGEIDR